ncbi:MAG: (2Fe-2S) ferredoxin domain-containing protein [Leptolyngbyaceae cyanobacterium RM1_406_9]|nr:(2Fe-2S) ferredoxin domain-containing protein [Leptolyngbyaceae cyanobacterium RM1_406_9]
MACSDTYQRMEQRMEFSFECQFLEFVRHDGKLKYIRLKVLSEEMQVKLPKFMRATIGLSLQPGELIQVTGIGKFDRAVQTFKLKATQIVPLRDRILQTESKTSSESSACIDQSLATQPNVNSKSKPKSRSKVKVLVCQKSGCMKRGGRGLCEVLGQMLYERGLDHQVAIERTGCLKTCSSAPNVVITPGNHRYTNVHSKVLPQIVDAIAQILTEDLMLGSIDHSGS